MTPADSCNHSCSQDTELFHHHKDLLVPASYQLQRNIESFLLLSSFTSIIFNVIVKYFFYLHINPCQAMLYFLVLLSDIVQKSQEGEEERRRPCCSCSLFALYVVCFTFLMVQDSSFCSLSVSRACSGQSFGEIKQAELPCFNSPLTPGIQSDSPDVVLTPLPLRCSLSAVSEGPGGLPKLLSLAGGGFPLLSPLFFTAGVFQLSS